MRRTLVMLWMLIATLAAQAQDILFYNDGREVQVKVTEISTTEVKYKRFDNLEGPTYSSPKSELFMVKYKNGQKETFQAAAPATEPATLPIQGTSGLSNSKERAAEADRELKEFMYAKEKKEYDDNLVKYTRLKKKTTINGAVMTPLGLGMMAAGIPMVIVPLVSPDAPRDEYGALTGSTMIIAYTGMGMTVAGVPIFIVGAVNLGRMGKYKRKLKALEEPVPPQASIAPFYHSF
jgi:hypothetical protein